MALWAVRTFSIKKRNGVFMEVVIIVVALAVLAIVVVWWLSSETQQEDSSSKQAATEKQKDPIRELCDCYMVSLDQEQIQSVLRSYNPERTFFSFVPKYSGVSEFREKCFSKCQKILSELNLDEKTRALAVSTAKGAIDEWKYRDMKSIMRNQNSELSPYAVWALDKPNYDCIALIMLLAVATYLENEELTQAIRNIMLNKKYITKESIEAQKESPGEITQKYKEIYLQIIATPIAKKCTNHKPLTAAFLFVATDLTLERYGTQTRRSIEAKSIFSFLENDCLSEEELKIFDKAVALFSKVVNGEITAKGIWWLSAENHDKGWLESMFDCYGDVMLCPEYLDGYESQPWFVQNALDSAWFTLNFTNLFHPLLDYMGNLTELIKSTSEKRSN